MKCLPGHIKCIKPQEVDKLGLAAYASTDFEQVLRDNFSLSAWVGNRCMGAAGLVQIYPGRALAWALLSADAGPYLTEITRKAKQVIDLEPTARIEITVLEGFEAGHRWAELLGFVCETPKGMRRYGVLGQTEFMYAKVK